MDQQVMALLKRKLEALRYTEPVDNVSAPLVQKLLDDLVHTTETYRGLKHHCSSLSQHISGLNDKARLFGPFK
jgi:hypothetical protein